MPLLNTLPAHSHCEMCHRPITAGDRMCGEKECEEKFQTALRAKKRGMYMFVGLIFVLLVLTQLGKLGF